MQLRFDRLLSERLAAREAARHEARSGCGVSCAEVAEALPSILDGASEPVDGLVTHVGGCLRCQAELARYRRLLRLLNQLGAATVEPPPGAVADVLAAIEQAAQRRIVSSALSGHRLAYAGAILVPAGAIVAVGIAHRSRLRRVQPVVLS